MNTDRKPSDKLTMHFWCLFFVGSFSALVTDAIDHRGNVTDFWDEVPAFPRAASLSNMAALDAEYMPRADASLLDGPIFSELARSLNSISSDPEAAARLHEFVLQESAPLHDFGPEDPALTALFRSFRAPSEPAGLQMMMEQDLMFKLKPLRVPYLFGALDDLQCQELCLGHSRLRWTVSKEDGSRFFPYFEHLGLSAGWKSKCSSSFVFLFTVDIPGNTDASLQQFCFSIR